MSYQVLARKWRPNTFSELVGQDHVVAAITNALDNNRLHHAYLFTGTRGVGKTTIARIFAKSLNCETGMGSNPCGVCPTCKEIEQGNFVDLLEIDAASRTKVEDTRELLDNVQYKPTRAEYKVYLIDEVHMLSKHSFNALLKTLEEPPPHVKFLLATTDPQKLPITILSRCLQFTLKALTRDQIQQQLAFVLDQEKLEFDSAALHELARAAQGSMRDSLSLTDQAIAQGNGQVTAQVVADMLGLLDRNVVLKLLHALLKKDKHLVLKIVDDLAVQSPDFGQLLGEIMSYLHQVALTQFVPEACKLETHAARAVFTLAKSVPPEQVQLLYQIALQGRKDLPHAVEARVGLEMTLLRMLAFVPDNKQLQSAEVAEVFTVLPKTSLTTLEQERQQAALTSYDASRDGHEKSAEPNNLLDVEQDSQPEKKNSEKNTEQLASFDQVSGDQISTESVTAEHIKNEPQTTQNAQGETRDNTAHNLGSTKTTPVIPESVLASEQGDSAHANIVQTAPEPGATLETSSAQEPEREQNSADNTASTESEQELSVQANATDTDISEHEQIEDSEPQDLRAEHSSLLEQAQEMRAQASFDAPNELVQENMPSQSNNAQSVVTELGGQEASTVEGSEQLSEPVYAETNGSQTNDPQLTDAYAQYLSSMPEHDDDNNEPDIFDPSTLTAAPPTQEAIATDNTQKEQQETEQSSLVSTEELLALRTQISDTLQQATDDSQQSDDGNDAIARAIKGNVTSKIPSESNEREKKSQLLPKEQPVPTQATHSTVANHDDLPPWEEPATSYSVDASEVHETKAEEPAAQHFMSSADSPVHASDSEEQETVFVDTRSGWLPGMDDAPEASASSPPEFQESTASNSNIPEEDDWSQVVEFNQQIEDLDFDIPYQLADGQKVIKASQLDTWSQLIESMNLTGLTKQVAIHSMYKMQGETVNLTIAADKQHLVGPNTAAQLTEALTQALRHNVVIEMDYGEVTDTPFAVQQAINRMRMQQAHKIIADDPQVQLLCQTFNAAIISDSIKPK